MILQLQGSHAKSLFKGNSFIILHSDDPSPEEKGNKKSPLHPTHQRTLTSDYASSRITAILDIIQNYAALSIVIVCAVLVVGINTAAGLTSEKPKHDSAEDAKWNTGQVRGVATTNFSNPHAKNDEETIAKDEGAALLAAAEESQTLTQTLAATSVKTDAQDPENEGDVSLYTVKDGDTLGTIAQSNDISIQTLYWANEIDDVDDIAPGDTLFILPVSGIKHTIATDDTIDVIAKEYNADKVQIIAFNQLPANGELIVGAEIIIIGGNKDLPEPEPIATPTLVRRDYVSANGAETAALTGGTEKSRKGGNSFPYGYCTYYVAQKKNVTWRGNAGAWLYNAKAQGKKTGSKPKSGSIVVTTDDPYYGHVAYVEKVKGDSIVISEMNYRGWGKVNTRTIPIKSRSIRGYIY